MVIARFGQTVNPTQAKPMRFCRGGRIAATGTLCLAVVLPRATLHCARRLRTQEVSIGCMGDRKRSLFATALSLFSVGTAPIGTYAVRVMQKDPTGENS